MSNKVKRKVTVENSKEGDDHPRRPSVFERLGPNAVNISAQSSDRHSRSEQNEKCRNWLRTGTCTYGKTCRFQHPFPSTARRSTKPEKDMEEKDLRHRVRPKREEPKASRTGSLSPKRVGKRSNSRSRKGEHESKIKSTVVVTRPRSPTAAAAEPAESKKKAEGWEDDSDDWPMDAAQLDFKEELTLERKRQQLQRELALELQKERLLNENVTITKTVSFSESSSTSSSSDSGSISSSSGSSSSSSDEESDDSSSSSSSSSSSGSRQRAKKRNKKASKDATLEKSVDTKAKDDYDRLKTGRTKSHKARSPSPVVEGRAHKKSRDKRKASRSPKRRHTDARTEGESRSNVNVRVRGPRTPSPVASRKQRQWAQSSSTDSRSADAHRNKGKRHKKKRDGSRGDKRKSDRGPTPPPLSSPNRTAVMPSVSSKKSKRDESKSGKTRRRGRDSSPLLLPRNTSNPTSAKLLRNSQRFLPTEKAGDKRRSDDRSKFYSKKEEDDLQMQKRTDSRERSGKRSRISPRKEIHKSSPSPFKDRYDSEIPSMKKFYPPLGHKDDKGDRRQASDSPIRTDRRKLPSEMDKKRDVSPRGHDSRRDNQFRTGEGHYDKRSDQKSKRLLSPEQKKGRDERSRDYTTKERNAEYEPVAWSSDHRKSTSSTGRRTPETRGRQEIRTQPPGSQGDRSRDRDIDRKKRKDRDHSARSEDSERTRLVSPRRSQSPLHGHLAVREIEPLTGNRGRMYESDIPPAEREYAYGYDPLSDPYDRLLPPADYESDIRGAPLYSSEVYSESRYRRDGKDSVDRYTSRDVLSPREILPHRDVISLTGRSDDYLADLPIEERGYDERWSRGRGREDWDAYSTLPPAPLPPHVAAALDEDRYGMPRRRRASPADWPRSRVDDRDTAIGGHRQVSQAQTPRDERSRSPAVAPTSNRGSAISRGGANSNRGASNINRGAATVKRGATTVKRGGPGSNRGARGGRQIKRSNNLKKLEDDLKAITGMKDRRIKNVKKEKGKGNDDAPVDVKKEKPLKRPHSPSPAKDAKRRREDTGTPENAMSEKGSFKKIKEEPKGDSKSALSRIQKSSKLDTSSPRSDSQSSLIAPDKVDTPKTSDGRNKEREEKKLKHDTRGDDDDFSDWSDGDDDLLNRDDFVDSEGTNDNIKGKHRTDEKFEDGGSKRRDRPRDQQIRKIKESGSRTSSRDRCVDDPLHMKDGRAPSDGKDADVPETASLKDDAATDVDEYITAESVDYDPISDDELDALIEEPEESILKPTNETEKSKIVDSLDVNWSALMNETKTEFKPGFARRRFTAAHVLSRIGFSQALAGPELSGKIISACQKQLDEEKEDNDGKDIDGKDKKEGEKFVMEHQIASFHVAVHQTKKARTHVFNKVGPFRRALCARRDLQIRNLLCRPVNKFATTAAVPYSPHYSVVDKDLYKQSLELLRKKSSVETKAQTVDVC